MSLLRPLACVAALCAIVLARPAHLDLAWSSASLLAAYVVFVVALPGVLLRAKLAPDDDLLAAEASARRQRRGLWADGKPVEPRQWRDAHPRNH